MCDGKVGHEKIEYAWSARRKGGRDFAATVPYLCKFCGLYHLGHRLGYSKYAVLKL